MPVPSDSLASLSSMRLPLEAFSVDAGLVAAHVVAAHDVVARELERDAGLGRALDDVVDQLVAAGLDDLEAAALLDRVALDAVVVGRQADGRRARDVDRDAAVVVGQRVVGHDVLPVGALERHAGAAGRRRSRCPRCGCRCERSTPDAVGAGVRDRVARARACPCGVRSARRRGALPMTCCRAGCCPTTLDWPEGNGSGGSTGRVGSGCGGLAERDAGLLVELEASCPRRSLRVVSVLSATP